MKVYLNLTNGIEALNWLHIDDYRFVRIQSTAIEQHRFDYILQDLDYNFLMDLALGEEVIVIDGSRNNKKGSKAIFYGLEWIRFALYKAWFNKNINVYVNKNNVTNYFLEQYKKLKKSTKQKLKYFRKFLSCNDIKLIGYSFYTDNDGNYDFFKQTLITKQGVKNASTT